MDFNIQLDKDQFKSYSPEPKKEPETDQPVNYTQMVSDNQQQKPTTLCSFFSLQYYQPYFNVTQNEVVVRVIKSFTPWKKDFFDTARKSPDLYGPFWIMTTIVFLLHAASNVANYFHGSPFKLELLRYGAITVYSFGLGLPILVALLFKLFEAKATIFHMLCLYGYSLSCFLPLLLVCAVPVSALQWIFIFYGVLNSSAFLILNIKPEIEELAKHQQYIIYGLIGASQLTLFLVFKLVFFEF